MDYLTSLITLFAIFSLLAVSADVLMGYGGMLPITQAAIFGIGAYAAAIANSHDYFGQGGVGWIANGLLGIAVAAVVGLVVSLPAVRVDGHYLLVTSVAAEVVLYNIFLNSSATGGSEGIVINPPLLTPNELTLVVIAITVVLITATKLVFDRSFVGRRFLMVKGDPLLAASVSARPATAQLSEMLISAALAGTAGVLYVIYQVVVTPQDFSVDVSFLIVVYLIFGGTGSIYGAVVGTLFVYGLTQVIAQLDLPSTTAGPVGQIAAMIIILTFIILRPEGLFPRRRRKLSRQTASPSFDGKTHLFESATTVARSRGPVADDLARVEWAEREQILEVSHLAKSYGSVDVLTDVNFSAREGERLGIIGPNGAGKSTLVGLVTGALPVSRGRVLIGSRDVTWMNATSRAKLGVRRTFQEARLWDELTVHESLLGSVEASGLRGHAARAKVEDLLDVTPQILPHLRKYPRELSSGNQKLVSILTALSSDPKVLLLDEPTATLSRKAAEEVMKFLSSLDLTGRTLLIVEHNLWVLRELATRTIFIAGGRVQAEGDIEELITDSSVVNAYFGKAAGVTGDE